eukprot:77508_1
MSQTPFIKDKQNRGGPDKGDKADKNKQSTAHPTIFSSSPSKKKKSTLPSVSSVGTAISIPNTGIHWTSSNNQCCSKECCVSLTYSRSVAKKEDLLPELQSNGYFCENMDFETTGNCDIDFIVFPLSSHCNLQQIIYSMRWVTQSQDAIGYQRAVLENDIIKFNNAETFYINPNNTINPISGFNALKFPVNSQEINQQISMCTLIGFGDIIDTINNQRIHIGYMGTNTENAFSCSNDTIRDICSVQVDTIGAKKLHFTFDHGKFDTFEHNGYTYTNRDVIGYCIIFIVCFIVINCCIAYVCYQRKIVKNIARNMDIVEEESIPI